MSKTTTKNVTLKETIKELEKAYEMMNTTFFGGELTPVLITLHTAKKGILGWYSVGKVWENGQQELNEINIVAEHLKNGKMAVLQTLMHEAVHHLANIRNVKDTSRNGKWHNKKFVALAEEVGMYYPHESADSRIGYSAIEFTKTTFDTIDSWDLDDSAFSWSRKQLEGGEKKKKTTYKWTCSCEKPQIVRTTKPELRAYCPDCESAFECQD